jgi:threonine synthase
MRYISTRGQAPAVSFTDAILSGLAPDGGLYVPEQYPAVPTFARFQQNPSQAGSVETAPNEKPRPLSHGNPDSSFPESGLAAATTYQDIAATVLQVLAGDDLSPHQASAIAHAAYAGPGTWPTAVTPLNQIATDHWLLELFHGPSLSFKDVAMQMIGPLYEHALEARGRRLSVLCATSGDTGGAAAEALKGRARVDLFIVLPKGRVSDVQRRFMTASGAANVFALEIEADFDACQALVKQAFADRAFTAAADLSAVNSINWARILAQSAYYHATARALGQGTQARFVVPTGNFGDAFSGYVAKRMGASIGKIVIATNANDILARALNTGRYERAPHSLETLSPAMDIQVASNFERILFEALGRDGAHVARLYQQFAQSGGFDIPAEALAFLHEHFEAHAVSDAKTSAQMRQTFASTRQVLCPHTAVGVAAAAHQPDTDAGNPTVTLATAHPAKFPETVLAATGQSAPLPDRCADLFDRPEQSIVLPNTVEALKAFIQQRSRAWNPS